MNHCDAEASLEIELVNLLERLEYLWNSPVREMIDSRKTDFTAK